MDRRFYTGKKKGTLSDMVELETVNRMVTQNYPRRPIVRGLGGGRESEEPLDHTGKGRGTQRR